MLSSVYRVVTKYETDTTSANAKIDRLDRDTKRLGRSIEKSKGQFAGFFSFIKRATLSAGALGFGFLIRHAINLNKELESTKIAIASAFQFQGLGTFSNNLVRAKELMKEFRKAAITSPGESRDLAGIAKTNAPFLAQVNATNKDILKFSTRTLGAAFSQMGGDVKLASSQALQILQGRGGSDLALFNTIKNPLAETLGVDPTVEALNGLAKSDPKKFFQAYLETMKDFDDANAAYAKTFGGLWASVQETFNNLVLDGAAPFFDYVKMQFSALLGWVGENEKAINDFAVAFGSTLVKGLNVVVGAIKIVASNLKIVLGLMAAIAAQKVGAALSAGGSIAGLATSGRVALGASVASGVGRYKAIGRGVAAPFKHARLGTLLLGGGGYAKHLAGAAGGAVKGAGVAALGGLGAALSSLAVILPPLLLVIGMVVGAMKVFKDKGAEATIFLKTSFGELMQSLDVMAGAFGASGGFVTAVKDVVGWITNALGTGVVGVFGLVVKGTERLVSAFNSIYATFSGFLSFIGKIITAVKNRDMNALSNADNLLRDSMGASAKDLKDRENKALREQIYGKQSTSDSALSPRDEQRLLRRANELDKIKKDKDKIKGKGPKVEIIINQEIKTDANPDRIAFAVRDLINNSLRLPRSVAMLQGE